MSNYSFPELSVFDPVSSPSTADSVFGARDKYKPGDYWLINDYGLKQIVRVISDNPWSNISVCEYYDDRPDKIVDLARRHFRRRASALELLARAAE